MTLTASEIAEIRTELDRARAASSSGNQGKARVCARRAAGAALRAHYRAAGRSDAPPAAQSLLTLAAGDPALARAVRDAAARLSASVASPGDAAVPGAVGTTDPVADALTVIGGVAPQWDGGESRGPDG